MSLPSSIFRILRLGVLPCLLVLALAVSACGGDDEEPEATPTAPPPETAAGPLLLVEAEGVSFRESESDDLMDLDEGEEREVEPGANVVIGESGRATVTWEGYLRNQLLAGTDSLLSLSLPAERRAILDQAAGTARYTLSGDDPADLQVIAGWITVAVAESPADLIVSFIPGDDPTAWVAMLEGEARIVGRDNIDLGALGNGEAGAWPQSIETRELDAEAVPGEEGLPLPQAVDATRVLAWYQEVAFGEAGGSIASVAFRCAVAADDTLVRLEPDAEADEAGEPLAEGEIVDVLERDASGEWLRINTLTASVAAWVAAEDLVCNGPVADVPLPAEPDAAPTATARPLPTRVSLPTWTPGPSPTPSPTATPILEVRISFSAGDDEITKGECTTLNWEVTNAESVYLDGDGVTGTGSRQVCPDKTTSYTLEVNGRDGIQRTQSVEVEVEEPDATQTPEATNTPRPQATNTPRPTAVPPTAAPTARPTDIPFPTATFVPTSVPPTAEPPTAEPQPTAEPPTTEPPTAEPQPTAEPPPTATDEP